MSETILCETVPTEYSVGTVPCPSRVVLILSLSATPKHAGEGGSSAALGPVANAQPTQGRGVQGRFATAMLAMGFFTVV